MSKLILVAIMTILLLIPACSPAAPASKAMMDEPTEVMIDEPIDVMMDEPIDVMMDEPTEVIMDEPAGTAEPTNSNSYPMMAMPAWFETSLTNVITGEEFKIADFKGKVILVETMAMWCPTCKKQQGQVKALHSALGMKNEDLVSISLDVDLNESAADLKAYSESNGFDWIYVVATAEVANEIGNLYGDQFLNPPSTPILIIDRNGLVHTMPFGIKSADDLKGFIEPFLAESM